MSNTKLLKISDLIFDEKFYPREFVDSLIVEEYAVALDTGVIFPPIIVGVLGGRSYVVDGWHRTSAREKRNIEFVDAVVKQYSSERELFADAVRFNNNHGKALNRTDKLITVEKLTAYKFSIDEITNLVHLPKAMYEKLGIVAVTAPSGKKVSFKGSTASLPIINKAPDTRDFTVEHVIDVKNQLKYIITLLESDDPALKNSEVQEYLRKLREKLEVIGLGEVVHCAVMPGTAR